MRSRMARDDGLGLRDWHLEGTRLVAVHGGWRPGRRLRHRRRIPGTCVEPV
jgi:hypothetical protein